jgi:predicted molibdopterin-dependent oxidoreductase YjgC
MSDAAAIRREIARAIPLYAGIETLSRKGDQVQWGGRTLYADGRFATPDGRAHFAAAPLSAEPRAPATFLVSTRRGKQFNSMIQRNFDPLTGAHRDSVLMSAADMAHLQLEDGAAIRLRSPHGSFEGRLMRAPIKPGNLEVHWPEGMSLLAGDAIDPDSMEPDYNATVTVEPLVTSEHASAAVVTA